MVLIQLINSSSLLSLFLKFPALSENILLMIFRKYTSYDFFIFILVWKFREMALIMGSKLFQETDQWSESDLHESFLISNCRLKQNDN